MEGYLPKWYVMGLRVLSFLSNSSGMWLYHRHKIIKNVFLSTKWLPGKHWILHTRNYTLGTRQALRTDKLQTTEVWHKGRAALFCFCKGESGEEWLHEKWQFSSGPWRKGELSTDTWTKKHSRWAVKVWKIPRYGIFQEQSSDQFSEGPGEYGQAKEFEDS